jgi:hypothetical protein
MTSSSEMPARCAFVVLGGARKGVLCNRPLKDGRCYSHLGVAAAAAPAVAAEAPAAVGGASTGIKRRCPFVAIRGLNAGQTCNRLLKDGRCCGHPSVAMLETMTPAPPATVELTVEVAAEAEVAAQVAVDAATEADRPLLIVALCEASHVKARSIAHENLATKPRAILERHAVLAMAAAGQIALAELDVEGQTLTAQRSEKKRQYMKDVSLYWTPFVLAK